MRTPIVNSLLGSRLAQLASIVAALFLSHVAPAAEPHPPVDDNLYNYLQLFRSDFNSAKVELVNRIMKLSEADAKKFWPIYREYEEALGKQAIQRAEFIAEFMKLHAEATQGSAEATAKAHARAKDMAKRWFKNQRARLDLLEKYHGKIQKALTPLQAGQFLQIEHQIGLFVDVTIAGEMPLVGQTGESASGAPPVEKPASSKQRK